MKRNHWFIFSFTLNAILAVAVVLLVRRPNGRNAVLVRGAEPVVLSSAPAPADDVLPGAQKSPPTLSQWIEQSRAAGISDPLLAAMVVADFNQKWIVHQRDFDRRYWLGHEDDASRLRFNQQRETELENSLRATLGEKAFVDWDKKKVLDLAGLEKLNLSPAEEDAFYKLQKDWSARVREFEQKKLSGELDQAAYDEQFTAASAEFETQRRSLLGESRYAAMLQPGDNFYVDLRHKLGSVKLSDDEFDALAQAGRKSQDDQAEIERQFDVGQLKADERDEKNQAIETARQQAYEQVLGTDGYANFQKQQDNHYEALKQYAAAVQLTASDVDYLYGVVHDYEKNAQEYKRKAQLIADRGQAVDWTGIQQNLQLYSKQTEQTLRAYLGDDRFNQLKQNNVLELSN